MKKARKGETFSSNNINIPICNLKYMKTVSDWIALYFQNIAATLGGGGGIPGDGGGDAGQKIGINWGVAKL